MKKFFLFSLVLFLVSCNDEKKNEFTIDVKPVPVTIERFDKMFYEAKGKNLTELKQKFPYLFPNGIEDSVYFNKINDTLLLELYSEVQTKYSKTDSLAVAFGDLFAHMQHYYPQLKTPKVITVISEVDREAKAIYTDSLVLISLDCYLGENHKFYADFPEYQRVELNENQMLPDLVDDFSNKTVPIFNDYSLLAQMIYHGKKLYVKDLFLPSYSDASKIAYTQTQLDWCKENETQMWSYFIENDLLYKSDRKNEFRFINKAPFSKFYLEIDSESPGKVGQWLGWQIVRSFMKNNTVSLSDMLAMDAKTLFERSKYKPKK